MSTYGDTKDLITYVKQYSIHAIFTIVSFVIYHAIEVKPMIAKMDRDAASNRAFFMEINQRLDYTNQRLDHTIQAANERLDKANERMDNIMRDNNRIWQEIQEMKRNEKKN